MTADGFEGRSCLVVGLGRFGGGLGAARWLIARGARVTVTDRAARTTLEDSARELEGLDHGGRLELVLGTHDGVDATSFDLVVASPAVPPEAPLLRAARAAGVKVTSEVELYLERSPARLVGVTGTQGKSSTVTFAAQLARACGLDAHAGGNLGGSLLDVLAAETPATLRVLELSSYQLAALSSAPPRRLEVVAITNVLADHLERHGTLEAYAAAKARLLELLVPDGLALLPHAPPARDFSSDGARVRHHGPGAEVEGRPDRRLRVGGREFGPLPEGLPGWQASNAALALALLLEMGIEPEPLQAALAGLAAPDHRCVALPWTDGRRLIDNGVATTPDATLGVLDDVPEGAVVLLGGASKGLPWTALAARLASRGDAVVAFGAAAE